MAKDEMNIYQKLSRVRKQVEVVKKNKDGFNYKYVTDDELLAKITGTMDKYELSLIPSIVPGTFKVIPYEYSKMKYNRETRKSYEEPVHELLVQADMIFTWIDNITGENIQVPWVMTGHQADASQSMGSALTYAYRYFLLKFFGVATPEDDPDDWRSKQRAAELSEDKAMAASIMATVDAGIKRFVKAHPDKKEEMKSFASKYAKDGKYLEIQESALARKMLEDFQKTYAEGE